MNKLKFHYFLNFAKGHVKKLFHPRIKENSKIADINGITFKFDFGLDSMIYDMYFGLYEIKTVQILKEYLKNGEIFVDVGANIGYLSAIAASIMGKGGVVHCFEPVPFYFDRLSYLKDSNKKYNFKLNNIALGESESTVDMDIDINNIGWNTVVPNFMSNKGKKTISVDLTRLDKYLFENDLEKIDLLKIDTEGFEFPILKGMEKFFDENKYLPPIVCEIAPTAYPLLGYNIEDLIDYMHYYSYNSYDLFKTPIDIKKIETTTDVLFLQSK